MDPDSPKATRWIGISLPGSSRGAAMHMNTAGRVHVPPAFAAKVLLILKPGATLYVTDAPVLPSTTGPALNVLNSDPPPAVPAP